jgi:capsular polysaccharide biosynthesis protein
MQALTEERTDRGASRVEDDRTQSGAGISGMEIADYIKMIRKRVWVVLLIPMLAAFLMTAIIFSRPTEYSATATVAAPWLVSNAPGDTYATANGAQQFVADFTAAISIAPVVDAVADATGASPDSITQNVTTTPIGESTLIEVRYVGANRGEAEPVARAVALVTLRFLFRPSVVAASELDEGSSSQSLSPVERLELLLAQPETVSVSPTRVEPTGPALIRGLQVAVGGGILLGLLVVIALEMLPFGRRRILTVASVDDRTDGKLQPGPKPGASVGAEGSRRKSPSVGAEGSKRKSPSVGAEGSKRKSPSVGAEGSKRKSPSVGAGRKKTSGVSGRGNKRRSPQVDDAAEGNGQPSRNVGDAADGSKQPSPSNAGAAEGNGQPSRNVGDAADGSKQPSPSNAGAADEGDKGTSANAGNRKSSNVGEGNEREKGTNASAGEGESTKSLNQNGGDHADGNEQKNGVTGG